MAFAPFIFTFGHSNNSTYIYKIVQYLCFKKNIIVFVYLKHFNKYIQYYAPNNMLVVHNFLLVDVDTFLVL